MDIAGLLKGIESHWEYAVFLFSQERLDGFLSQFDKKWKAVCQGYRKLPSMEDALFRLTLDLSAGEVFVWRGKTYHQLLDMEKTWEEGGSCEKDVLTFLKCGLACIYLKKKNADREQVEFAERLQVASRITPIEACGQFFQVLRGDGGFQWEGAEFFSLADLVDWLACRVETLDEDIECLFQSKSFAAWLACQGLDDLLDDIKKKCGV